MNKYELAVVLSAKINDEERAEVIEKIKDMIARLGGTVADVEEWGKKTLAYEIQKMREGYYYFIHFDADSQVPAQIEEKMRIAENVLRYLIVRPDDK